MTEHLDHQNYKRSIILLFSTQLKVTLRSNQTQCHNSTIITQSNLYEINSSRHYKCKGLFTEEFQSFFRIAESLDSQSEDRISKSLQKQLETSERFRTINHFLLNTIGNNNRENSLKGSCHLRLSLNTTQMCESTFKLRITIDHTGHVCNTLNLKIAQKTNPIQLICKLLLMSCSKFLLIEGLNTTSRGIDNSLSTVTTELSLTNV